MRIGNKGVPLFETLNFGFNTKSPSMNSIIMFFSDSRNELVKDAVSAILDQGDRGKSRDHGNREYSTSSDSLHQVSSASTLRDTESIKEVQ